MKYCFLILILISSFSVFGQKTATADTDRFSFLLVKTDDGLILSIRGFKRPLSCIDQRGAVYISFTDESKMILSKQNLFVCPGKALIFLGGKYGKNSELNQLAIKKIKTLRVDTFNSFVESDISEEQATSLMNLLKEKLKTRF